jgi:hypothetical protein
MVRFWRHNMPVYVPSLHEVVDRWVTTCTISLSNDRKQVQATGKAVLNPIDRNSKVLGKKIALTSALTVFESKEVRTNVWKDFWSWVSKWSSQNRVGKIEKGE